MKRISALVFTAALVAAAFAQPSITVGEYTFVLASSAKNSTGSLREYMLKGESIDHWTRLTSVRVVPNQEKPREYLERVAAFVMKSHPSARARLLKSEKTGAYILDFLTFSTDSSIAEFNLMRARYEKGNGLIVFQYAVRYSTLDRTAGPAIIAERLKMTDPFAQATFEETKEANQAPQSTTPAVTPPAGQEARQP